MNLKSKAKFLGVIVLLGQIMFGCELFNNNPLPNRSPQVAASGIQGQALKGPINSGPAAAGDCNFIGFAATFYVKDEHGQRVATFNSDVLGWFSLNLVPGQYEIVPDKSAPLTDPELQLQQVNVAEDEFSNVVLHFNTSQ
jgi:hypothetical protein